MTADEKIAALEKRIADLEAQIKILAVRPASPVYRWEPPAPVVPQAIPQTIPVPQYLGVVWC